MKQQTSIEEILENQNKELVQAFKHQCNEDFGKAIDCLENLTNEMFFVIDNIDNKQNARQVINNTREILSQEQQTVKNNINQNYGHEIQYYNHITHLLDQQSQNKQSNNQKSKGRQLWTEEEKRLFIEGYEKFGRKDIKSIADHIKSRRESQVKSYLQKYEQSIAKNQKNAGGEFTQPVIEENMGQNFQVNDDKMHDEKDEVENSEQQNSSNIKIQEFDM